MTAATLTDCLVPFGRYRGQSTATLPGSYTLWLLNRVKRGTYPEFWRAIRKRAAQVIARQLRDFEPSAPWTGGPLDVVTFGQLGAEEDNRHVHP